jgi:hypothetical protein
MNQYLHSISTDDRRAFQDLLEFVDHIDPEEVRGMYCTSTGLAHHDVKMAVQVNIACGNEALRKLFPELARLELLDQEASGSF